MISLNLKKKQGGTQDGFTLLELLIVISIIAILSIALVFMLNPAETLKKARDAQRISDLKTVKTALGIWLTSASSTQLSLDNFNGSTGNVASSTCLTRDNGAAPTTARIAYSSATAPQSLVSLTPASDTAGSPNFANTGFISPTSGRVDGYGWIPVNLKSLTSGTPISSFPVDPVNALTGTTASSTSLVYRYACQNATPTASPSKPAYIFEIDAVLESNAYTNEDNKMANDGGDNNSYFEQGNSLNILPTGTGF